MVGDGKTVLIPVRTVKNVDKRIGGAEQEAAAFSKHPVSLVKNRLHFGDIGYRYRTEYQVESTVSKGGQIPHISPDNLQGQMFPLGDQPILAQLGQRVVEYGNIRSGCRQNWRLLPAAAGKAEDFYTGQIFGEPVPRYRLFGGKQNGKKPARAAQFHSCSTGHRPLAGGFHLIVPRLGIVGDHVDSGHKKPPLQGRPTGKPGENKGRGKMPRPG